MRLVVNIPTYNEEDNIEEVIKKVLAQSKKIPEVDLHVLVSDSHSPDGTGQIVKNISKTNPKVHYLDVKEKGLGIGIVKGHRFAVDRLKADLLAQLDGDMSHDPSTLPEMVGYIQKGYDLVIGSRLIKGGKNLLGWHRRLFTRGSALFCKICWGTFAIAEYTNSYRVFNKNIFEKIDFKKIPWKSKTYIIQPAFLYGAIRAGAKIKEIPITFQDRKKGYSKAKIISYTFDVLKFGIKVRLEKSAIFIKFLLVGTISFMINAIVLGLLSDGQIFSVKILTTPILNFLPPVGFGQKFLFAYLDRLFFASIISNEIAIVFNFIAHESWTFKNRSHKGLALFRFFKFNLSSIASPIISIFTIQIFVHYLKLDKIVGLAVGVVIGLFVNYAINILWIWKEKPIKEN